MSENKLIILPCSGIGKSLGTITRWTAYELVENLRPNDTRLFCLARLVVTDEEAKDILSTHQIITIDGCPKKCSTKNVERNTGEVFKSFSIAHFMRDNRDLRFDAQNVIDPGKGGEELAKRFAAHISEELEKLKEEELNQ